ncbi:hypothetical protein ACET3Z_018208 [Daucus carota]
MEFLKCSLAGNAYCISSSVVEVVASKQMAMDLDQHDLAKNYLHSNDRSFEIGFGFHPSVIELENIVYSKSHQMKELSLLQLENLDSSSVKGLNQAFLCMKDILSL